MVSWTGWIIASPYVFCFSVLFVAIWLKDLILYRGATDSFFWGFKILNRPVKRISGLESKSSMCNQAGHKWQGSGMMVTKRNDF